MSDVRIVYPLLPIEYTPPPHPPHKWLLVGCSLPLIRLAEHPTVLRAWRKQCLPGSVITRSAPSPGIAHMGARVYRDATTAMRDIEYTSPARAHTLSRPGVSLILSPSSVEGKCGIAENSAFLIVRYVKRFTPLFVSKRCRSYLVSSISRSKASPTIIGFWQVHKEHCT